MYALQRAFSALPFQHQRLCNLHVHRPVYVYSYFNSEPVGDLHGLVDVSVERVGDEDDGHLYLVVAVDELLERLQSRLQHLRTSRQHAVDVETDSELRLCAHSRNNGLLYNVLQTYRVRVSWFMKSTKLVTYTTRAYHCIYST